PNQTKLSLNRSEPSVDTQNISKTPDLIVYVRPDRSGNLEVQLQPIHPDLVASFNHLHLDDQGEPRWFSTNDLSTQELDSLEAQLALRLKGIADQKDQALQQALAQSPSGQVTLDSRDLVNLSESDRNSVNESFLHIGQYFYMRLFQDNDEALK